MYRIYAEPSANRNAHHRTFHGHQNSRVAFFVEPEAVRDFREYQEGKKLQLADYLASRVIYINIESKEKEIYSVNSEKIIFAGETGHRHDFKLN